MFTMRSWQELEKTDERDLGLSERTMRQAESHGVINKAAGAWGDAQTPNYWQDGQHARYTRTAWREAMARHEWMAVQPRAEV